ncbi:MAG: 50S ribosomal protein L21 [Chlamydiota bacterium]
MSMYAIIESGGKQFRVEKGDKIEVELLTTNDDGIVDFKVLFINNGSGIKIGKPYISDGAVRGKFIENVRGEKKIAFKYKQRKNYRRKVGHRQNYSKFEIIEIAG